jgi:hypothetical protein
MLHFFFAPVAQKEERDASNVEAAGSSPARSSNTLPDRQLAIVDLACTSTSNFNDKNQYYLMSSSKLAIGNPAIGNTLPRK